MAEETLDVLIVGAGISGIGAAYFLQRDCPDLSFEMVEARDAVGGTWDLFRYPGIRSDSDMYTLGYSFKPWTGDNAIADGPSILAYLNETVDENGLREKIRFGHKVLSADFDSSAALWTVTLTAIETGQTITKTCRFLFLCSGYYDYDQGYLPVFDGYDDFKGTLIHPQRWPEDLDYTGKKVVVVGSGATAVTIVPAMADKVAQITMLQRTPSYLYSLSKQDGFANALRRFLPAKLAYGISRWRRILYGAFTFNLARSKPQFTRNMIRSRIAKELGDDPETMANFDPPYNPWEQRLCLVPDSDFFKAMRAGKADIKTGHIERFDDTGIQLTSGEHLEADIIVTATGLNLQFLAGADISVDGEAKRPGDQIAYKGMMYAGVPNLATSFGYTNASWTLKSDLTGEYVARLLNHMRAKGCDIAVPELNDPEVEAQNWVDFSSGYFQRVWDKIPKQGSKRPWQLYQSYFRDLLLLRHGKIDDGVMQFKKAGSAKTQADPDITAIAAE